MQEFKKSKVCPMFNIVKNEDRKYVITVGQYIASNKNFDTPDRAERYIGTKPWELIVNVMQITLYYNEKTKKLLKNLQKQAKKLQKTQITINEFFNQCYKNYKSMKTKVKKIWLIMLCTVCLVCITSCNVTRVMTNESQYFQKGDTAVTIQTKTIETYNATKNK